MFKIKKNFTLYPSSTLKIFKLFHPCELSKTEYFNCGWPKFSYICPSSNRDKHERLYSSKYMTFPEGLKSIYWVSQRLYNIQISQISVFRPNGRVLPVHGRTKGPVELCVPTLICV